ncbi:MAG TPA: hypothetical protein VGO93_21015 [Candidatus Xenobia bacterium]|jgi:hypothetical protein
MMRLQPWIALSTVFLLCGCGGGSVSQQEGPAPALPSSAAPSLAFRIDSRVAFDTVNVYVTDAGSNALVANPLSVPGPGPVSTHLSVPANEALHVVADAFSAGQFVGSDQGTATVAPGGSGTVSLTLTAPAGLTRVLLAGQGSGLAAFNLPALTAVAGFHSPVSSAPAAIDSLTIAGQSFFFLGFASASNNLVPMRLDAGDTVTALPAVTVPGGVGTLHASNLPGGSPVLFVGSAASSNNVHTYPIANDGVVGDVLSTATVGGQGNTPVGLLGLTSSAPPNLRLMVLSNGPSNNLSVLPISSTGVLGSIMTSGSVGGAGNLPVGLIEAGVSTSTVRYAVLGGSSQNLVEFDSISLVPQASFTVGGSGNTPVGGTPAGNGSGAVVVVSNGASDNLTTFAVDAGGVITSQSGLQTVSGAPVAMGPVTEQGNAADNDHLVFIATSASSGNLLAVPVPGGSTTTATALGATVLGNL